MSDTRQRPITAMLCARPELAEAIAGAAGAAVVVRRVDPAVDGQPGRQDQVQVGTEP